jgi:DNA-directed RNA polymerase specialized sigma24 family protein
MDRIKWIDERLQGWARWVVGGGGGYGAPAVYNVDRVDQTADVRAGLRNTDPAFDAAALETDMAIAQLPADLKRAVKGAYTWEGDVRSIAETLGVTQRTLHNRLCNADRRIAAWIEAKRERAKQLGNNLNYATFR